MNRSFLDKAKSISTVIAIAVITLFSAHSFAGGEVAAAAEETASGSGNIMWFYFLLAFAAVCIFIIIGKTIHVLELTYELNGKKMNVKWNKINGLLMFLYMFAFLGGSLWEMNTHGRMLLPESASEHGLRTDYLFNVTLVITGIVFIVTHIALFWFAYKYKGSEKRKAYFYPHNDKLEMYWTVIPAIVLAILVISGWKTWNDITKPAPKDALTIDVVGEQFMWNVRYPGADGVLGTKAFKNINDVNKTGVDYNDKNSKDDIVAREIYLPVNRPVDFTFGAKDVIHSAYMPHFRAQMNCVPGMPTKFWFVPRLTTDQMREKTGDPKFEYLLLCAKICGAAHYNMQMKIVVVTEAKYQEWLATQKPFYTEEIAKQIDEAEKEKMKASEEKMKDAEKTLAMK